MGADGGYDEDEGDGGKGRVGMEREGGGGRVGGQREKLGNEEREYPCLEGDWGGQSCEKKTFLRGDMKKKSLGRSGTTTESE